MSSEYTSLRKFYAWFGFISLVTIAITGVFTIASYIIQANAFIDAGLKI